METVKVKSWHESQGEFVVINAEDFDPAIHEKWEEKPEEVKRQRRSRKGDDQ